MKKNVGLIAFYVILLAIIAVIVYSLVGAMTKQEVVYSDIIQYFREDKVKMFAVTSDNVLAMTIKDGDTDDKNDKVIYYQLRDLDMFREDLYKIDTDMFANIEKYDYEPPASFPWWVSILPYVVIFGILIFFWFYAMKTIDNKDRKMDKFGKAKVKVPSKDKDKVRFTDVAGADEEKAELEEVVDFLKDPVKFTKLGAKIPHGVLLVGPPGTGKTLLAKAVAGEAGVPFFSISGSDFVEMYVGVGASRVRDLFDTARKAPASIVFIDEIDAVGRHRGAGLGGGHDEREQTLNQLLVEMDGFGSHEGIIVIAATNRPDILDPALLRPGRFDRQIHVGYPDIKGREEILRVHAKGKPFEDTVDLATVAKTTSGFTGADLANLLNEAALLAARRNKLLIGMDEIEDAFIKIIAGPKKSSRVIKEEEKRKTAYHEAGHAIISYILPHLDPVHQISIIPSGGALGYTLNIPTEDKYSVYREQLKEKITELLGGRAAEKIVFDDISGGASNDIERASSIARRMVTKLGMSDNLGPISFGSDQNEVFLGRDFSSAPAYSEEIAAKIDEEVHKIIAEAYDRAIKILSDNMEKLKFIADYLLHCEIMDADQFKAIMEGTPTYEELDELSEEKKRKSRKQNEELAKRNKEKEAAYNTNNNGTSTETPADKPTDGDGDSDF